MTNLGTLGGTSSGASGINASGQVVGVSETAGGTYDAFLYYEGVMTDLNSLLPAGSDWDLEVAAAINDSGQIAGYGINPQGQTDAFLLDTGVSSSPEPTSFALFGTGIALLALVRRKLSRL
jgi:probable HAF family extracellular repeat protein